MNIYILYLSLIIIFTIIIGSIQKAPNCIPATAPKEKKYLPTSREDND